MVWAKTRLILQEYVFEPRRDLILTWSGKHPEKLYTEIHSLILDVFNIPSSHLQEMLYSWDTKGSKQKFKVSWRAIKEFDIYTYLRVDINFSGSSENGVGKAVVVIKPRLYTEFPQDNYLQQTIIYEIYRRLWQALYYDRLRRQFKEESRILVTEFYDRLKELVNAISLS